MAGIGPHHTSCTTNSEGSCRMRRFIVMALVVILVSGVAVVASAGQGPPPFDRQPSPEAVVAEHIDALNNCDVDRLMAQYPETVAILLPGGVTSEGRTEVRALFEGVCLSYPAGVNGLLFIVVNSWTVGRTVNG